MARVFSLKINSHGQAVDAGLKTLSYFSGNITISSDLTV